MLENIANIKILLIEESCSPVNCCHRVIALRSLCQQLKSSMGDIMTLLILIMWPFLNIFKVWWPQSRHSMVFKYRNFILTDLFHGHIDIPGV